MEQALRRADLRPSDITIVNTHATGTKQGDIEECNAIRDTFADCPLTRINNTKSSIGHAMGAAGVLELAGNLPSFTDHLVHPTINLEHLDPECALPGLVAGSPQQLERVDAILNNSFGMLGINSVVIVERFVAK
jgi:3-oxoacyl-[acyl-carrier-protein] synthase II